MTAAQLDLALAEGNDRERLAVALGAYAGLRRSEMAHLRYSDVRLDEGLLVVRQGKGGKDRTVPLSLVPAATDSRTNLDDGLLDVRVPSARNLGFEHIAHSGFVLGGVVPNHVSHIIRNLFHRCGIDARPHDLRHTFGTELARLSNGNLTLVAGLMGHTSVATTQRYVGWTPAGAEVVDRLHRRAG